MTKVEGTSKEGICRSFYFHIKQTVWTSTLIFEISDFRPECSKICQDLCSFYVKQSLIPECNNSLLQSELPFTSKPDCWMFSSQKRFVFEDIHLLMVPGRMFKSPGFHPLAVDILKLKHQLQAHRNFEIFFFGIARSKSAINWYRTISDH